MNWKRYFDLMADWKMLPAYKTEPRVDSLIGYYLPDLIRAYLQNDIIGIIPELPIRLGTVKPLREGTKHAELSYKVDFFAVGANGINYLIEFKTDSASRRDAQDLYLIETKEAGSKAILEGVFQISKASKSKKKYRHLLEKLRTLGLLNADHSHTGLNPTFEIIYVQPSNSRIEANVIDFVWIANWLRSNYPSAEFETEFANALERWAQD